MKNPMKGVLITILVGVVIAIVIQGKWDWLIYPMFLLCPLMHLIGHNHGGHDHSEYKNHPDHHKY